MFMLINKVKNSIQSKAIEELFSDEILVEMLAEDPSITKKREETKQAIVYLEEAIDKISFMQASGDLDRDE